MREAKKRRLEAKGWRVGSAGEFLGLDSEEEAYIDIRLRLSDAIRRERTRRGVTQAVLAKKVRSSQSRVAKMEAGEEGVSLDLLVRTLLVLGATRRDVGRVIASAARAA
jgi:ribosome-binding protein aMBF1 (putative translation factor)